MAVLTAEQREDRVRELWRRVERDERILAKTRERLGDNLSHVMKLRQEDPRVHVQEKA